MDGTLTRPFDNDDSIQTKGENDNKNVIFYGPWGGFGGNDWNDGNWYTGVREIIIMSGGCIDSIRVIYDMDGHPFPGQKHGGNGGSCNTVSLQWPYEYLQAISGYCANYVGSYVVRSLTFTTNKKKYGPFGVQTGTPFCSPSNPKGKIVGFSGRSDRYLDQIGVHAKEKLMKAIYYGPWGGCGGNAWNDGSWYDGVREIIINSGWCIDSIRVIYDDNGTPVSGQKHGGDGGDCNTVSLQWPYECLQAISGYYATYEGNVVVRSLTFITNVKKYGPFGRKTGTPFSSPVQGGKIVGFAGKSDSYVNQIGVYATTA